MELNRKLIVLIGVFASGCASLGESGSPTAGDPEIVALLALLEGSYRGPDATVAEPGPDDLMTDTRRILKLPQLAEHVMYWEVRSGDAQRIYRRVLMVFSREGAAIVQSSFRLRDGLDWPGEVNSVSLAGLGSADFVASLPDGCDSVWRKVEGGWSGYLDPDDCRVYSNRQQRWRRIEGETIVTAAGLRQTERGFSDAGEQLFGTPLDEYHILERF
jgi:hypothetical protein